VPKTSIDPEKRKQAHRLRSNVTDAERMTWRLIRARRILGAKFRRQQAIGPYIVDFFCPEFGLVIEIDGSQHAEDRAAHDAARTQWLESKGYRVIRFWNVDVLQWPGSVAEAIYHALGDLGAREPPPSGPSAQPPPPQGGREGNR